MVEPRCTPLLLALLSKGAHARPVKVSTTELAAELECSQQSVSRWLIELEKQGMLMRSSAGISLTKGCVDEFRRVHSILAGAFQPKGSITLKGKVFTGLGEGGYYISRPGYRKAFKAKLGIDVYPGTLNLRLQDAAERAKLDFQQGVRVEGFKSGERFFGGLTAYHAVIGGKVRGAVIVPDRTHYGKDIVELIAAPDLRKALRLKDGDMIEVKVEL